MEISENATFEQFIKGMNMVTLEQFELQFPTTRGKPAWHVRRHLWVMYETLRDFLKCPRKLYSHEDFNDVQVILINRTASIEAIYKANKVEKIYRPYVELFKTFTVMLHRMNSIIEDQTTMLDACLLT